ncbi:methyltransferase domain protein [Paenibacillus sp. oral taxon 786 str. D14]|uniref:class I SAM-dependent methyltransferase n=1 Tax=Paenibacillus sp. oral taxon 786 TaxID=652715 RepID=UPI0001AFCBBE|nr:class I SAM-dependent methyltransferase [Paenibacillus sp. oral taxon 786]EES74495.1 methyltransferase domain protein [Paenibacillus sp. oral taxon 786 str. D14]
MNYHEIIAAVGEGSAHPGGFQGTLDFIQFVGIAPGMRVLEVGCGTGRTACLLAQMGAQVTAMDQSIVMLEKAEHRAQQQQLQIEWIQGDITAIPLRSDTYDAVIAESVTVFAADPVKAFREYHRVLRKGGQAWDRELFRTQPHLALEREMRELYGNPRLPDAAAWMRMLRDAGFQDVRQWGPETGIDPSGQQQEKGGADGAMSFDWQNALDPYRIIDLEALQDPAVGIFFRENEAFLQRYRKHLSYGVFLAKKAG